MSTSRQRLGGSTRRARSDDDVHATDSVAKVQPGKILSTEVTEFDVRAGRGEPGKLTRLDVDPHVLSPDAALHYARAIDRKAESGADEVDDGALASAFGFLDDARAGERLPEPLRRRFEHELGCDLRDLRVHADARAARAAAKIRARAFTIGSDIYFAAGAYDPASEAGLELIAHEVAHVAHARGGQRGVSRSGDAHEQEADAFAREFVREPRDALPGEVRADMERAFDADFSAVRVHEGPEAAARGAIALTQGTHIHFRPGAFDPHSTEGRSLLGHELAHVVQQARGGARHGDAAQEREADQHGEAAARGERIAMFAPAIRATTAGPLQHKDAAPSDVKSPMDFGEASREVQKLGRVQAPKGVYLQAKPTPRAPHTAEVIVPFDAEVYVTRETLQPGAKDRWCYVVATEHNVSGFVPEMFIAVGPPDPASHLHRVTKGETLGDIATAAYGKSFKAGNDQRLYVQGLYEANKDRAGVRLDRVELSRSETWHREEAEEKTLQIYQGVKILEGMSIWVPSEGFIQRLKSMGAITSGSSEFSKLYRAARDVVDGAIEAVKYIAGFVVGLLEGAFDAIKDLFVGAVEMISAVVEVVWNLITGDLGAVKKMLTGWVDKMKAVWEHRADIAEEFMKKWNAPDGWDRGRFQGEVLGWVMMTTFLILVTMGEDAPAAVAGIVNKWPALVKLLQVVDAAGDVGTYLGAAMKTVRAGAKLPAKAVEAVATRARKGVKAADHVAEDIGKDAGRLERKSEHAVDQSSERAHKRKHAGDAHVEDTCFVAGTMICTDAGLRPIETIAIGTRVLATEVERSITAHRPVLQTYSHVVDRVLDIIVGGETITCTAAHPFWAVGRGWTSAGSLNVDDRLLDCDGAVLPVIDIAVRRDSVVVYNLRVEQFSTFHVSQRGVLVHNKPMRADPMRLFEARRVSLHESIEEFRTRLKRLESVAKTDAQRAEIKRLNREADNLERQLNATRYQPPPAGADPTAQHYDPLEHLEHAESRTLEDLDKLEKDVTPQRVIPSDRPALDSETVLGEAAKYSRTGKTYQGRQIYRGGDGKLYYVDNLHKGAASEIEVFSATGEHLGTMSPDGVFDAAGKVKGRYLPKDKL